jgi:hypothetical protein
MPAAGCHFFSSFDFFGVAAVASLGLVLLVFLMKRSVAEKNPKQK